MIRVIKVGGSLLMEPRLVARVGNWIGQQEPATNLVIFGGGKIIEAVRELDAIHSLDPSATHWHCVDLLNATFQLACDWFESWGVVATSGALSRICSQPIAEVPFLVRVDAFYHPGDAGRLPQDWRTTTDSIAAHLANKVSAQELVLLKSCEIVSSLSIGQLATAGIVDQAFPEIAARVNSIRVEQLTD